MSKSGKRIAFTQPSAETGPAPTAADAWVRGDAAASVEKTPAPATRTTTGRIARLTIDLPEELHTRFKAACAQQRTKMVDEIRRFIEGWTQEHRNP